MAPVSVTVWTRLVPSRAIALLTAFTEGAAGSLIVRTVSHLAWAAPLSVIYAYVSEYFGGAQNGLGSRIASNIANSKNALVWAYVLGACLLGLAFYLISIAMEAVVTPGGMAQRNRDGS